MRLTELLRVAYPSGDGSEAQPARPRAVDRGGRRLTALPRVPLAHLSQRTQPVVCARGV